VYLLYYTHLAARHVTKFRGVTALAPKVTSADMLNFKPIFDPPLKKL